jgi:hypothetical protein
MPAPKRKFVLAALLAFACSETPVTSEHDLQPQPQAPVIEYALVTAQSLERMSATYSARCSATDPDGDLETVVLSGDALASGASYAETVVTLPRLDEFTAQITCTAMDSTGLSTSEEVLVEVPSPDRPVVPAYYDFFTRELADNKERVEGGILEMRLNGRDTVLEDSDGNGWIRIEHLLPQTIQLRYRDEHHTNPMQVIRRDDTREEYGPRVAANWSGSRLSFTLPPGGAGYAMWVASDSFDRERYRHVKTGDGGPFRMLCESFDPDGWDGGDFQLTFWYDGVSIEKQDSLLLAEIELRQQLSGNARYFLSRNRVFEKPPGAAMQITSSGQSETVFGPDGCVDAVTYVPPDAVSVAEATIAMGRLLFFPVWDDALFEDGAFTDFAREVLSADAAIGPDPAYFTR